VAFLSYLYSNIILKMGGFLSFFLRALRFKVLF
jgi:hypothetical protein